MSYLTNMSLCTRLGYISGLLNNGEIFYNTPTEIANLYISKPTSSDVNSTGTILKMLYLLGYLEKKTTVRGKDGKARTHQYSPKPGVIINMEKTDEA